MGPPRSRRRADDFAPALPHGSLERALSRGVKGLRIGIEEREWRDATRVVAKACEDAVEALERAGAKIVHVQIPLARFAPAIGYVTIGLEACAALARRVARSRRRDEQGSSGELLCASDPERGRLLDACRLRAGLRRQAQAAFADVDLLALPTTAMTAPSVTDAEMASGFVDASAIDALCRFAFLANLTGLPAGSAPVGARSRGLPIGFQLVGDAWDEATVLGAMAHLERLGIAKAERPIVAVDILGGR